MENNTEDAKVVLMSGGQNMISLAKELHNRGYLIATIVPQFAEVLNRIDIPAMPLSQAITPELQNNVSQMSMDIINDIHLSEEKAKELGKLISGYVEHRLTGYLFRKIPDILLALYATKVVNPDLVIVHNDVEPVLRGISLWAQANDVPCLHVPHAVYIHAPDERTGVGTDIHDLISATHLACAGDYQAEWYLERGFDKDKIYKTGLPQLDEYNQLNVDRERACRLLKLNPDRPIIMYASSWRQDTNLFGCHDVIEQTYIAFLKAVKDMPVQIIVKLHPNAGKQSMDWHMEMAKKEKVNCIITEKHRDIILVCADIVMSYGPSNILLNACNFNAKLMCTHGYEEDDVVTKTGYEPTNEDIANAIIYSLESPALNTDEFKYKYCGVVDGKSFYRIANIVDELIEEYGRKKL